ncbi:MAG: hypothetical protein ISS72_10040 [Candidatus Brocadiae bacterium]|nr:hypothetical protein [Candidatus Brocadiia bacterium]
MAIGRRNRIRRPAAIVALLAAALTGLGSGCLPTFGAAGRAKVRLHGRKLLVAPFRMPNAAYFESKVGALFARQVEGMIHADLPKAKIINLDAVPIELTSLANVDRARLTPVMVAREMGADYVLYGEIHMLQGKKPKSFGVLQGMLIMSARVVDLNDGKVVWRLQPSSKKYHYPPLLAGTELIPAYETDEEDVIRKVMLTAALELAAVFTGRKPEPEKESKL